MSVCNDLYDRFELVVFLLSNQRKRKPFSNIIPQINRSNMDCVFLVDDINLSTRKVSINNQVSMYICTCKPCDGRQIICFTVVWPTAINHTLFNTFFKYNNNNNKLSMHSIRAEKFYRYINSIAATPSAPCRTKRQANFAHHLPFACCSYLHTQ